MMYQGILTSAGMGQRLRPLNEKNALAVVPKGLLPIMGIPITELHLHTMKAAGISDVYMITVGPHNRDDLQNRFGNGRNYKLHLHWTRAQDDVVNNGSGDAILTHVEQHPQDGYSLWLPNDNTFRFDAQRALETHAQSDADLTVLVVKKSVPETAETYGVPIYDDKGRVIDFYEKRSVDDLLRVHGWSADQTDQKMLDISTAGYIFSNDSFKRLAEESWVKSKRKKVDDYDMGKVLIKDMIQNEYAVRTVLIDDWRDFGQPVQFIQSMKVLLSGAYAAIDDLLRSSQDFVYLDNGSWVHNDTMAATVKGKSLDHRIRDGDVRIGPHTYLGSNVALGDGVEIESSNIEFGTTIGSRADLHGSYARDNCQFDPHVFIRDSAFAQEARVSSSKKKPTKITGYSAIGAQVVVPEGRLLDAAMIHSGYKFQRREKSIRHERRLPKTAHVSALLKEINTSFTN